MNSSSDGSSSEPEGARGYDNPGEPPRRHAMHRGLRPEDGRIHPERTEDVELERAGLGRQGPADIDMVVARTDRSKGGKEGLSAFSSSATRPEPSTKARFRKLGHRSTSTPAHQVENCRVPAANLVEGTKGNGDLAITKAFTWSSPIAGIAAVGVMRTAFEFAYDWSSFLRRRRIPHHQSSERRLFALRREDEDGSRAGILSWKAAHYHDQYNCEGQECGALAKCSAARFPSTSSTTRCGSSA